MQSQHIHEMSGCSSSTICPNGVTVDARNYTYQKLVWELRNRSIRYCLADVPLIGMNFWNALFSVFWAWSTRIAFLALGGIVFLQNAQWDNISDRRANERLQHRQKINFQINFHFQSGCRYRWKLFVKSFLWLMQIYPFPCSLEGAGWPT